MRCAMGDNTMQDRREAEEMQDGMRKVPEKGG